MIELSCTCGGSVEVPASFVGESAPCTACGRGVRALSGDSLHQATFAARLVVASAPSETGNGARGLIEGDQVLLAGDKPLRFGKAQDAQLFLPGKLVSRSHCRLVPTADGWEVHDTASTNGLFVNGVRTTSHVLQDRDEIAIGEFRFVYQSLAHADAIPEEDPFDIPLVAEDPPAESVAPVEIPGLSPSTANDDFGVEYELKDAPAAPPMAGPLSISRLRGMGSSQFATPTVPTGPSLTCPNCRTVHAPGMKICVPCGIDLRTGRPLITSQGLDENVLHGNAETTIRVVSWFIPFGLYPIASEAFGTKKPYVIWSVAAITILASCIFFVDEWTTPNNELPAGSSLMLWCGDDHAWIQTEFKDVDDDLIRAITPLIQRQTGEFHAYQLLTHALLHGGIMHLAGNLIFLIVLGTRVNALLGNVKTAIIYPLLAIAAGLAHMIATANGPRHPMLGASGAIMGLAGMYIVLFPAHRVYMAIWLRLGMMLFIPSLLFKLFLKIFAWRGFWVVLFYIAFDIVATLLGSKDGVAHWAHLGGFLVGTAIAIGLLMTRQINARGGDLITVVLGKHAWPLVGRPRQENLPAAAPAI